MLLSDVVAVVLVGLIFAFIAVVFANWILHRRYIPTRTIEFVTGSVQSVTELFARGSLRQTNHTGRVARLILIDAAGGVGIPDEIPLHRGRVTIGRDPEMVNVPIQERRISRYHCRINEEEGGFCLWDEGSTSGTYVNDEEVGHTGRILKHGDLIEIGPIIYRFLQDY